MKNQYVGDIRDFEKYAILRALAVASGLPLVVAWMLTPDDASGEGRKLDYLEKPTRYRHLDPHVFDGLKKIVGDRERSVEAVERAGVLEQAAFFGRELKGQRASRFHFFAHLWRMVESSSLVFFDPDTGIAPARASKDRAAAVKYIFEDEIVDGYRRGHSVVVFDHFKRVSWPVYLAGALPRLRIASRAPAAFALHSAGVAFLILPQPDVANVLERSADEIARRWSPELKYTSFRRETKGDA